MSGSAAGADGCRHGWVAVRARADGGLEATLCTNVAALRTWTGEQALILIDIPIGLREGEAEPRACDVAARRLLRAPRAASVFTPPPRPCLAAADWVTANQRSRALTGRGLSRQAWNIAGKIREVDDWLRTSPERQALLREAHPEVLFQALNGGRAMAHAKRLEAGRAERLAVLERHTPGAAAFFERERATLRRAGAAADDLLDAMACAVAARMGEGRLTTLPEVPERDAAGLCMEIVMPVGNAPPGHSAAAGPAGQP